MLQGASILLFKTGLALAWAFQKCYSVFSEPLPRSSHLPEVACFCFPCARITSVIMWVLGMGLRSSSFQSKPSPQPRWEHYPVLLLRVEMDGFFFLEHFNFYLQSTLLFVCLVQVGGNSCFWTRLWRHCLWTMTFVRKLSWWYELELRGSWLLSSWNQTVWSGL